MSILSSNNTLSFFSTPVIILLPNFYFGNIYSNFFLLKANISVNFGFINFLLNKPTNILGRKGIL